jgi:hypothetical protein
MADEPKREKQEDGALNQPGALVNVESYGESHTASGESCSQPINSHSIATGLYSSAWLLFTTIASALLCENVSVRQKSHRARCGVQCRWAKGLGSSSMPLFLFLAAKIGSLRPQYVPVYPFIGVIFGIPTPSQPSQRFKLACHLSNQLLQQLHFRR